MNAAMATRNLAEQDIKAEECTEFQLHTSQYATYDGLRHKVYDFAEHRLLDLAHRSRNRLRRDFLFDLIERYRRGDVAIGWLRGEPKFVQTTRG